MSVKILAHELGHAYHGDCIFGEKMLNASYTSPVAETASIFCETIVKNAALNDADESERFALLENIICDAGYQIVDIYSRFLFEKGFFEKRRDTTLSTEEIKQLMYDAQKQAFGNGLDHDKLHPYMWICKDHYYSAHHSFYNYPYTFGLLFAKGVYAEYLKQGDAFIEKYDTLLSITGKNTIADVTKTIGIDVESVDFWRSSVKTIQDDIEEFLRLCQN